MPVTYRELISQVRLNLLEPHPAHPSEVIIWHHLRQNAGLLFNQALNTPVSWAIDSTIIAVNQTEDIYPLMATNFGKDVLVEAIDPTDPNFVARPVRRMSLQSSLLGGNSPYVTDVDWNYTMTGDKFSVNTMIFIRDLNGGVSIKVMPKPTQTAFYKIWYDTTEPNTDALGNSFSIPAGENLLCLRVAWSCLPATEWPGYIEEQNIEKRRELGITLNQSVQDHDREYRKYIATDRQPGLTVLRGFQDSEYYEG